MTEDEISYKIIGTAIDLHRNIGPGLLESAYETALGYDLQQAGLSVKRQVTMPFEYKDVRLEIGYRIDLVVNDKVLIEVKSIEASRLFTMLKLLPI